jgi:thiol-disulfide isomerase/thioredoxin
MLSRRLPRPVLLGATVLVIVVVAAFVLLRRDDAAEGPSSDEVRAVELEALDGGGPARLGDLLDGKPMVLNFFAQWCQPCREEMPAFEQVHQELGDDVVFVGVATRENPERSLRMVEETGVTYPTFTDPADTVVTLFDAVTLPVTVFIDADGNVIDSQVRKFDADGLRTEIAEQFGVEAA